jgi:hypothetical protein
MGLEKLQGVEFSDKYELARLLSKIDVKKLTDSYRSPLRVYPKIILL